MITKVQGSKSILSNFYPCQISVGKTTFPSAEHYYQFRKAKHHHKISLSRRILAADNAYDAKALSKQIRPNRSWQDQRLTFIQTVLQLKFDACPEFRQTLLATRGFIDHSVPDDFWGTGTVDATGANEFGLALARLRNQYQRPAKMTCLVLGHRFVFDLNTRIND